MKVRLIIVLLLISVFATSTTWASSFRDMYVFGDSLSDQGNFFAVTVRTRLLSQHHLLNTVMGSISEDSPMVLTILIIYPQI